MQHALLETLRIVYKQMQSVLTMNSHHRVPLIIIIFHVRPGADFLFAASEHETAISEC